MSEPKLTGAQEAAAVTRVLENIALRSGAGCGKTFVLARRFTELLMKTGGGENPLRRLVALTFTDKAALEMSQRVRTFLSQRAAAAKGESRRKLLSWLEELPEANISTIHSFCLSLLRKYAVEAGIDPSFAVCADDLVAARMIAEAADQAVLDAVEAQQEDVATALLALPLEGLVDHVCDLVRKRTAYDLPAYADPAATLKRWEKLIEEHQQKAWAALQSQDKLKTLEELERLPCRDGGDKLARYRAEQLAVLDAILRDPSKRTAKMFALLNAKPGNIGSPANWGSKEQVKAVRAQIISFVQAVQELAPLVSGLNKQDEQAARLLAAMCRLGCRANALYAAAKRRRGILDFDDLLDHANRLLQGQPPLREAIGSQIEQLLVDEAQDTDALQIGLLELLALGQKDAAKPPPGRLFLVGDGKQSIYRFRGAQVEAFESLCRRLGKRQQEELDSSFRTHKAGVEFVNHLFAPLMGADYTPIKAMRPELPPGPSVEMLLAEGTEDRPIDSAQTAVAAQAALTAQRIRQMIDRGEKRVWDKHAKDWRAVQAGDIAILFARMTSSLDFERDLARRGLPYYVVAGTGFFKQQEVFDILNVLRAVDNPFDDIALMGTLRSGIFGLDDNALMHIAEALDPPYFPRLLELSVRPSAGGQGESVPAAALKGLDSASREALSLAVYLLWDLHRRKDAVAIDSLIETVLDATGYDATLLSQFNGRRLLGNVRLLIQRARAAAAEGMALADFITQMGQMVIEESRYEQSAIAGEEENVVRLMTIHKAKGLEFPVVFVPDLNARLRGPTGALLGRSDFGLVYNAQADEDGQEDGEAPGPLSFRLARDLEEQDERKEQIRKLYVAATRHQDHLVFVAADLRGKDGQLQARNSYLTMLDGVLQLDQAGGDCEIPYGPQRQYRMIVRRVAAVAAAPAGREKSAGEKMLTKASSAREFADALTGAAPESCSGGASAGQTGGVSEPHAPPLVGPLPPHVGKVEIAVTALSEFELCPALYRWRYELRVPDLETPQPLRRADSQVRQEPSPSPLPDALTLGTIFHRCMELLDFRNPQPPASLARQAAGEMELGDDVAVGAIAAQLQTMLQTFRGHALWGQIASGPLVFRELDFVMDCQPAVLRGQIDMLHQDAHGGWHIVDYKSDRVGEEGTSQHARRYELQMLLYAAAAAAAVGALPLEATLYFLRSGQTHAFGVSPAGIGQAKARAGALAERLILARRSGRFAHADGKTCQFCPYRSLC